MTVTTGPLAEVAERAGVDPEVALRVWQAITTVTNRPDEFRTVTIGFVDLAGFTELSQQLGERELALLVERFEALSYNEVVRGGGRVVKMIGDEVMFVADDPAVAVRIAMRLVEATQEDDLLPLARAGVAMGPALLRLGDCHGAVVNLASRIVEIAPEGSVFVCEEVRMQIWDDTPFSWRAHGRRRLKGIGRGPIWEVHPQHAAAGSRANCPTHNLIRAVTPRWSEG